MLSIKRLIFIIDFNKFIYYLVLFLIVFFFCWWSNPTLEGRTYPDTWDYIHLAENLPIELKSTRLAMEAGAILNVASRLEQKLRKKDPLAEAVKLSRSQYVLGCLFGASKALITG